jgi:hypothetical protein
MSLNGLIRWQILSRSSPLNSRSSFARAVLPATTA